MLWYHEWVLGNIWAKHLTLMRTFILFARCSWTSRISREISCKVLSWFIECNLVYKDNLWHIASSDYSWLNIVHKKCLQFALIDPNSLQLCIKLKGFDWHTGSLRSTLCQAKFISVCCPQSRDTISWLIDYQKAVWRLFFLIDHSLNCNDLCHISMLF